MCHLHRLWFIGEMKGIYSTQKVSAPRILPRISPEEVALPLIIIYFIYMWFFSCHCHESSISWATRNGSVFSWSNFTCILGSPGFGLCEDTQLSTLLFPFSPWGYGALCWFLQNLWLRTYYFSFFWSILLITMKTFLSCVSDICTKYPH